MNNLHYSNQVDLLITVLDDVMKSPLIALKGGTAINLFILNMPRLSVDIDLTFLPVLPREDSLKKITLIFNEMQLRLERNKNLQTEQKFTHDGIPKQLLISRGKTKIKVELNLVLRGVIYEPHIREICSKAQERYGKYASVKCLSMEDLYAGKFCAALDRQHPRDLYDVYYFLKSFTLTEKLKDCFIAYLLATNRPIHEILQPNLIDQSDIFVKEFDSMTEEHVTYDLLCDVRMDFIQKINAALTPSDKEFLISFEEGNPRWDLIKLNHISEMPAIKWKLYNILKMSPDKKKESIKKLKEKILR